MEKVKWGQVGEGEGRNDWSGEEKGRHGGGGGGERDVRKGREKVEGWSRGRKDKGVRGGRWGGVKCGEWRDEK